jgi:hypothetical protein
MELTTARQPILRTRSAPAAVAGVDLYWLPLGAGGHSVRLNGRVFEAIAARLARRPKQQTPQRSVRPGP